MQILLAPMEGVIDAPMRALLTSIGGIDYCATEFIRVTSQLLPEKVFYRFCPELLTGGVTFSGTPVFCQLLGSEPNALAENAARAAELGAPGIDLNFGCPAKTVNRHDGGATLLKTPDRILKIVSAVRAQIPAPIPLTVKIRLGFHNSDLALENGLAAQSGGAHWLTVHGRTRDEGYRPPAHWDLIGMIRSKLSIPVIANGEIWSANDYFKCLSESGCDNVMLGRGIIARPDLAKQIKLAVAHQSQIALGWDSIKPLIHRLAKDSLESATEPATVGRIKQWTRLLSRSYPEADTLFASMRTLKSHAEVSSLL